MKQILSLGVLAIGLAIGLNAPPAIAAQGELAGTWTSIDSDGSNQTLTITGSGNRVYAISLFDDAASLCGGDPALAQGAGRVDDGQLSTRVAAVCLPKGNRLRGVIDIGFSYDEGTDTLTDDFGIVWSRA